MDLVAGVVDPRDHLRDAVLLARELADDQVVLVVAGERRDDVGRAGDPGPLEHVDLGRVSQDHMVLELLLQPLEPVAALLDQRHLVAAVLDEHAGEVRADLPTACDQEIHLGGGGLRGTDLAGADCVEQDLDRDRGRADRAQAALAIELGARRVEQPHDHALVVETLLVATTTASASSIPASRRTSMSIPWPRTKPPFQWSPSRVSASSFSSTAVTSQPSRSSWRAMLEPTRPQPITNAFMDSP